MEETTVEEFSKRIYNKHKATEIGRMINGLMELHAGKYSFSEWCTGFGSALTVNAHNNIVRSAKEVGKNRDGTLCAKCWHGIKYATCKDYQYGHYQTACEAFRGLDEYELVDGCLTEVEK